MGLAVSRSPRGVDGWFAVFPMLLFLMDWWTAAVVAIRGLFVLTHFSPLIFDAPRC